MAKNRHFAIRDNQIQEVNERDIDVEFISPTRLIGSHANVVPLANNAQSARLFYASRFVNQAMPLAHRQAPLVQTLDPESADGLSFEQQYGKRMGAKFADDDGVVTKVEPDGIELKLADGSKKYVDLYNNFQFNRKTYLQSFPKVQVGQAVKKGQVLAASNFTDDEGTMSMGRRARIALVPYKGFSMDDAIVVSESFAKRMASEHNYEFDTQKDPDTKFGKVHFTSLFPTAFTKQQLETLDDNGVVRPGTVLHKGDPIILATRPKPFSSNSQHLGKLSKAMRNMRSDASETWEHDYPGLVSDSVDGKKRYKVFATAQVPLKVGDKIIASRQGQKDIVSKILPDEHMLRSVDGTPFEVLLNPLALPSRVNTATSYELALGKLAQLEGKPIKVPSFNDIKKTRLQDVLERLERAGISDTEEVFDPTTNEKLEKPVATGIGYVYKLHHVVESKKSARGQGAYDCYSEDTEVMTKRGWVKWPDAREDDEFLTADADGNVFYSKASRLVSYDFDGELLLVYGGWVDLLVTDNHKLVFGLPRSEEDNKPERLHLKSAFMYTKEAKKVAEAPHELDFAFCATIMKKDEWGMLQEAPDAEDCALVWRFFDMPYIGKRPYKGKVYCATIPDTGILYVRRNGRAVLSGNSDEQPLKGGAEAAQAKRMGGLETTALMARGAYETLREGSTLRGQRNDDYFRLLRQGYRPADPGAPFVWDKFRALLNGAGLNAKDLGKGTLRLQPFTDRDLESRRPIEVKNGKMVDQVTLEAAPGGLFSEELVSGNRWGKITLPQALPNPAFETQIQQLLGITNADMRKVIAGEMTLEEAQSKSKK